MRKVYPGQKLGDSVDADGHDIENVGSLTTESLKNIWDHVLDPSEFTGAELQSYFNTEVADGDWIKIGGGTITLQSDQQGGLELSNDNLRIRGAGPGQSILDAPDHQTSGIHVNGNTGIRIEDLTVRDQNASEDTATPRRGIGTTIAADGTPGTQTTATFDVENVEIVGFRIGVEATNITEVATVAQCRATETTDQPFSILASGSGAACENVEVRGCHAETGGEGCYEFDVINEDSSTTVRDCVFRWCYGTGGSLSNLEFDDQVENNKAVGCTMEDAGQANYNVRSVAGEGNEIIDCISRRADQNNDTYGGFQVSQPARLVRPTSENDNTDGIFVGSNRAEVIDPTVTGAGRTGIRAAVSDSIMVVLGGIVEGSADAGIVAMGRGRIEGTTVKNVRQSSSGEAMFMNGDYQVSCEIIDDQDTPTIGDGLRAAANTVTAAKMRIDGATGNAVTADSGVTAQFFDSHYSVGGSETGGSGTVTTRGNTAI